MKKNVEKAVIALTILGVILLIAHYPKEKLMIQQTSFVFKANYREDRPDLVTEFDFIYDSIKKETKTVKIELGESSEIVIEELSGNSECRLILYQNAKEIWRSVLENQLTYSGLVSEKGIYELMLETEEGNGKGSVKVLP